jgi:PAS domain S-box-containing protein
MYGLGPDERIAGYEDFITRVHPEDREFVESTVRRAMGEGGRLDYEFRIVLPDGRVRWVAVRSGTRMAADGTGLHIIGVSVDITSRKLAEAEHRAAMARLEAAVESAGIGFHVSEDEGRITLLDDRTRAMFGFPPELDARVRAFWLEHIHPDDRAGVVEASHDLFEGRVDHVRLDYRYLHPTRGLVWYRHTSRSFERDRSGRVSRTAGAIQDITDQKRTEEDLRTLSRRLIQAQEAERALLARELHDDVTQRLAVLAIELGRAESSAAGGAQPQVLKTVREGLVRLSEDIHSLAYRLHPAVLEELGLAEALRAECERRERHGGIAVTLDLEPMSAAIGKDATLCLYRVAQEALTNVARHAHARAASVVLRQMDGGLLLAVKDDGIGFDPEDSGARGSLGLVSMRERLRLVNGTLDIESAPGQGTSIVAWVPGEGAPQ